LEVLARFVVDCETMDSEIVVEIVIDGVVEIAAAEIEVVEIVTAGIAMDFESLG
jgi:hypothetical protein